MGAGDRNLYDSNMASGREPVRTFGLFGESSDLLDLMHCETIAARSVLHNWELAPHRHARLHQLLVVESGGGLAQFEGNRHAIASGSLLNLPSGCVHGFRFRPGTRGYVVSLPEELLDELLAGAAPARALLREPALVPASMRARRTARALWREYRSFAPARALALRGLSALLMAEAARALARHRPVRAPAVEPPLLARFETLLEAHYTEHWRVSDYARALGVSAAHLSRLARAARGASASALIADRLMREARRYLAYTSLAVAQVADALGFSDPAYFSRVFARSVGLSPRAFRRRLAERPGEATAESARARMLHARRARPRRQTRRQATAVRSLPPPTCSCGTARPPRRGPA